MNTTVRADYAQDAKRVTPGPFGGHNWHPMAYSPRTKLVYIPTIERSAYFAVDRRYRYEPRVAFNTGVAPPRTPHRGATA